MLEENEIKESRCNEYIDMPKASDLNGLKNRGFSFSYHGEQNEGYVAITYYTDKFDFEIGSPDGTVILYPPTHALEEDKERLKGKYGDITTMLERKHEYVLILEEQDFIDAYTSMDKFYSDLAEFDVNLLTIFALARSAYNFLFERTSDMKIKNITEKPFAPLYYVKDRSDKKQTVDSIIEVYGLDSLSINQSKIKTLLMLAVDRIMERRSLNISTYFDNTDCGFYGLDDMINDIISYIDECSDNDMLTSRESRMLRNLFKKHVLSGKDEKKMYKGLKIETSSKEDKSLCPEYFYEMIHIEASMFDLDICCDSCGCICFHIFGSDLSSQKIYKPSGRKDAVLLSLARGFYEERIPELSEMSDEYIEQFCDLCSRISEIQKEEGKVEYAREQKGDVCSDDYEESKKAIMDMDNVDDIIDIFDRHGINFEKILNPEDRNISSPVFNHLIKIPWWQTRIPETDFDRISSVINRSHYGLEKVKKRILQYIAVQKRSGSNKGKTLCLVGPAGVGKSTIARSIAKALGLEFVKVSMNGVASTETVKGFDRSWRGAQPGIIIQGMQKCDTMNPVMLLDEVDKIDNSKKNLFDTLIDLLDPNQNDHFSDIFLQTDYDMSKVTFILTANSLDNMPYYLLDRLEVIEIGSYSDAEKLVIAKDYVIPKMRKELNLADSECVLSDDEISYIIKNYTDDCGVRSLERNIRKVYENYIYDSSLSQSRGQVSYHSGPRDSEDRIQERRRYIDRVLEDIRIPERNITDKPEVGIVYGLCVKGSYGGDVLPIEATIRKASGNSEGIILTGNLMDTIKESANVAYNYIFRNRDRFGISESKFTDNVLCINAPDGVKKDGPSAGVAFVTLMLSVFLNRRISNEIAMTGEISLNGYVMPIGGLREKVFGAYRAGKKIVFCPKGNEREIRDIPKDILNKVKVIPVSTYDDIYSEIFCKPKYKNAEGNGRNGSHSSYRQSPSHFMPSKGENAKCISSDSLYLLDSAASYVDASYEAFVSNPKQ